MAFEDGREGVGGGLEGPPPVPRQGPWGRGEHRLRCCVL